MLPPANFIALTSEMVEECAKLYCETYSSAPWFEQWPSHHPIIEFITHHLGNNYFMGYVIQVEKRIVGACLGFKKPWNQGVEYYIDELFIHPDFQGKGLGSAFMQYIEQQCVTCNLNAIILNTEKGFPSESYYRRNGFTVHEGLIILSKWVTTDNHKTK